MTTEGGGPGDPGDRGEDRTPPRGSAGRGGRAPRLRLVPGDAPAGPPARPSGAHAAVKGMAGGRAAEADAGGARATRTPPLGAPLAGAPLAGAHPAGPRPVTPRSARGGGAVREAEALHPLTTHGAPLLPPRGAAGARADVWEELDLAAAWVATHWPAERREEVRQVLRVLCVALRSGAPLRLADVPWEVPVDALAGALRRRLVEQSAAEPRGGYALGPDPVAVLSLAAALDAVEQAARDDAARAAVEQLGGVHALELLIDVAHDMRSPLGSILFLVERVRAAGGLDAVADRQLALVHGAAFGLSTVVSDVMELARGGDRLARSAAAPFAVGAVLDEVRAILAPVAEEKGLVFDVTGGVEGLRLGRAAAVQRVLLNLATNALKFTPRGRVAVHAEALAGDRVRFEVADTGPGIPAGVQSQLFQTFRDRQGARTPVFSSAGLGLAICQRLVAAQGGQLRVESAPGAGTRFGFELGLPAAGA